MPLWDKITVVGVIGTLFSVIASAIAMAFAVGGWKNEIESHLKEHDRSLAQIQADIGRLSEASGRDAEKLAAIQAILSRIDIDRAQGLSPRANVQTLSNYDPLLAERVAAIGKGIENVAEKIQKGIDIRLIQIPAIDLKQNVRDSPPPMPPTQGAHQRQTMERRISRSQRGNRRPRQDTAPVLGESNWDAGLRMASIRRSATKKYGD